MSADASTWRQVIEYDRLIQNPEVRDLLVRYAARKGWNPSAQTLLNLYDASVGMVVGVKTATIASIGVPIFTALGIKTGKSRSESLALPPGQVIVAALCSLAYRGQELQKVHQAQDGCVLEAKLPSDIWSWQGSLAIAITSNPPRTQVQATTRIGGQLFDWGKSSRCLERVFQDISRFPEF